MSIHKRKQQPRQIDTGFDRHSEGEITRDGWLGFRQILQIPGWYAYREVDQTLSHRPPTNPSIGRNVAL